MRAPHGAETDSATGKLGFIVITAVLTDGQTNRAAVWVSLFCPMI